MICADVCRGSEDVQCHSGCARDRLSLFTQGDRSTQVSRRLYVAQTGPSPTLHLSCFLSFAALTADFRRTDDIIGSASTDGTSCQLSLQAVCFPIGLYVCSIAVVWRLDCSSLHFPYELDFSISPFKLKLNLNQINRMLNRFMANVVISCDEVSHIVVNLDLSTCI